MKTIFSIKNETMQELFIFYGVFVININIIIMKIMIMMIFMMIIIIIIIAIMIMMIVIILIIAVVIINSPFQPVDFYIGSTTAEVCFRQTNCMEFMN